jgi:hypothetical protein
MENNSKIIAYKIWVERIEKASNEEFFPLLREFFDLLVKENPAKISMLEKQVNQKEKKKKTLSDRALSDLVPLSKEIEEQSIKEKARVLFDDKKNPGNLYRDIIHSLERLRNNGKFKNFRKDIFSYNVEINPRTGKERKNFYVSFNKFKVKYPNFTKYLRYTLKLKEEKEKDILPYTAYATIKNWNNKDLRGEMNLVELGNSVRSKIIAALNVLTLYLSNSVYDSKDTTKQPVWNPDFDFKDNTLSIPPYGECKFKEKTFGKNRKINRRKLLVKLAFDSKLEGISAYLIRKAFKEKGVREPDNREIDAMIVLINKRFKKCFRGAKVLLENIGSRGVKTIRLSVYP